MDVIKIAKYDFLGYIPNDDECAQEMGYMDYDDFLEDQQQEEYKKAAREEQEKEFYNMQYKY